MFNAVYQNGAWTNPEIVPFADITFSPAMLALHYGQSVFEGMKAFRMHDGRISIFRPQSHLERFNRSLDRMCMPTIPEDLFFAALVELLKVDQDWVPSAPGTSLYLRPFCFASEPRLKIKIADQYQFMILMSPAGKYFGNPYRLKVETEYTRTAEGGTGYAKCAGNYGSTALDAWYNSGRSKDFSYGINLHHLASANGPVANPRREPHAGRSPPTP
jgi:branched-chain amino acid aminotransferase